MNFKRLKIICIDRNVTIKELAFTLNISRQTFYTKVKNGTFTESEKLAVANKLRCKVSDL